MFTSNFLKNGTTLQGQAGNLPINSGDLLMLNSAGQLYSADVSDYAAIGNIGATCIPVTTVSEGFFVIRTRKEIAVNASDASIFSIGPSGIFGSTLTVNKYSSAGTLITSATIPYETQPAVGIIQQLSNGNLVVLTGTQGVALVFQIFDQNLNTIGSLTTVTATLVSGGIYCDLIPLSGGGFAVSYGLAGGVYLAIYTNTGSITFSPTVISGTPTTALAVRMAQLSSGNIAIAIVSSVTNKSVGHTIISATGSSILSYAVLDSFTSSGAAYPEISMLAGYYCIGANDGTNSVAYILNNAGSLQGSAFSASGSSTNFTKLVNDGVNFEFLYSPSSYVINGAFLPTSGSGYVISVIQSIGNIGDAFNDSRGNIVLQAGADVYVLNVLNSGIILTVASSASIAGNISSSIRNINDFAVLIFTSNSSVPQVQISAQKYFNTSIVGVSQSTLSSGNSGTIIPYSMGPGGYPCNQVIGSIGKSFDNSATNIVGNKGTIMGNGVALVGIV